MKLWDCLPKAVGDKLRGVTNLREIRLRNDKPVKVNVGGQWYTVGDKGLFATDKNAPLLDETCDDIVKRACNNSVYAYEKMLAKGFFTLDDGVRVGVCGEVAGASEPIFRKYSSLCFRIPHCISVADKYVLDCCKKGNVIVIGPPCSGKTTLLRDLAVKLSRDCNVLAVDERGEFFYNDETAKSQCDVLRWTTKNYAFEVGVRAMSPQWIVCDEIAQQDVQGIKDVTDSGVNVACSAHGFSVDDFYRKFDLAGRFETAIVLGQIGEKYRFVRLDSHNHIKKTENID